MTQEEAVMTIMELAPDAAVDELQDCLKALGMPDEVVEED